jgi:hypothetical protein
VNRRWISTAMAYFPLLDPAGNSVRGQLAARHLSRTLGLSLFSSKPQRSSRGATGSSRESGQVGRGAGPPDDV